MNDNLPPLSGIKVIDLTRYLAGPFCTQILGDYGAEVIKIEPLKGAREPRRASGADNYSFLAVNRSKKSVVVDIRHPEGAGVIKRLAQSVDVIVDNYRPGLLDKMGLGWAELSRSNPRLIACNISGFGSSGPMRDNPGFDQIAQGMSGLMSITGTQEGGPTRTGIAICDLLAGIFCAQGVLLALAARQRTGVGQQVETSLIEGIMSILGWSAGNYFDSGKIPSRYGNDNPLNSPHGTFMAADRPFNIASGNERMWRLVCEVVGRPELAEDERFSRPGRRLKYRAEVNRELEQVLKTQPADYWIDKLNAAGVPAGPILNIDEAFHHPQMTAREMLLKLPHPALGTYLTPGLAVKMARNPGRVSRPALLGEHTDEVLAACGIDADERARLRAAAAIG